MDHAQMNFETYQTVGRILYARLAEAVATILTAAIGAQPGMRLQHIQQRAKDPRSLKKKLERAGALESDDISAAAKDLAGCRAIFYTNSDVARFQSSGIITDNFVVDWTRTKIHHPRSAGTDENLFISNNYVIRLKDERLALAEYADLRDVWCELQVQTSLNHAWSEMEHDIYKMPALNGFGRTLLQGIEKRMKKTMRDYLLPAGYEFQKVVDDLERLSNGKQLFDADALRQLGSCEDNNARYEILQRFKEYVLPSYDDLGKLHAEVRHAVVDAAIRAYATERRPIETPFATLRGESIETVVGVAADILDHMRYFDVEATFDALCVLFRLAPSDRVRKRLLDSAETLSEHQLEIWKQAGPVVQLRLVDRIKAMRLDDIESVRPIVMKVLAEILNAELKGTSSTYNTVVLHRAAAVPSEALESTRGGAITVLKSLFREADSEDKRLEIVRTLAGAMQPAYRGTSDSLLKTILHDTVDIVDFYIEAAATLSYELLAHLEHTLLWQYRHKGRAPTGAQDPDASALRATLVDRIFAFRDLINTDRRFVTYKTLVGFESVFPPEWEGDSLDIEGPEAYRRERIAELVGQVSENTAEEWHSILVRCAQTESKDSATFISFGQFLEELGRSKPLILIAYLNPLDERLARFLPAMLHGLDQSEERQALNGQLRQWIANRRYLGQIIWFQRFASAVDPDLLESLLNAATEIGDDAAVLKAIAAAAARHGEVEEGLLTRIFLPALNYLTDKGDSSWVNEASPRVNKNSLFADMAPEHVDFVLASLVNRPQVDYRTEEILNELAGRWPMKVVDYFGNRLRVEIGVAGGERYEAIPYEFHALQPSLQGHPEQIVSAVRQWFVLDKEYFAYRGGRLLANIFPTISAEYERVLHKLCEGCGTTEVEFLVQVLRSYDGQSFTHGLGKAIVACLPADDPLLDQVGLALDSTGVLHGEFGLVEAYRQKMQDMQHWLLDPRERVNDFAKRHIYRLDQQIAGEQRRSEEDLEFRKRSYPSNDDPQE
jgi:ppGpp synthetase/RelA/SpoT-type nucleotidyltranferase